MNILVIGCDQVGASLIRDLEHIGHDISLIEKDPVAAVSEDDSVNLMAAQIARSIFRKEKVICRVSDPHLQVLYHKAYEIETICPTVLTEQSVFRALAK